MNVDDPTHGEPPIRSALTFPPCDCGHPLCPDTVSRTADDQPKRPQHDDRSSSPAMQRLRPLVEKENQRARGGAPGDR
ncbi:hypothetical protein ACX6XY_03570 [Streptomyces sp. O3]